MVELLIIAILVIWSTIVVFKKVFPQTSNKIFTALSTWCSKQGWHTLAKWLKPAMASGCGGNCACPATEEVTTKKTEAQVVKWK